MPTISWISQTDGDWSDGTNWQGGVVPGATDDVTINLTIAETITVSETDSAHSIAIDDPAATFIVASSGTLESAGDLSINVGFVQLAGGISSGGTIGITTPGLLLGGGSGLPGTISVEPVTGFATLETNGGLVTLVPVAVEPEPIVPCFVGGTRIETETHCLPIEQLAVGDRVRLVSGGVAPIVWIGHRRADCRRHPAPERVRPIRIAPHAFGNDRPRRTLLLSPDHAVFVEDVLIPVKFLVNGTTIEQIDIGTVAYYHLELPRHDVVLAEGLPAESYLETGGRVAFENGGSVSQIHPDFAPNQARVATIWQRQGYAPLLGGEGQVNRVRAQLAAQARMLGYVAPRTRRGLDVPATQIMIMAA